MKFKKSFRAHKRAAIQSFLKWPFLPVGPYVKKNETGPLDTKIQKMPFLLVWAPSKKFKKNTLTLCNPVTGFKKDMVNN